MNRVVLASIAVLFAAYRVSTSLADEVAESSVQAAQVFRAKGEAVVPAPDGTILCEAEEFQVEKPGWQARSWGENYYAATFANTFLSRKAFLGAPELTEQDTVATINVDVQEAGRYLVLVRYEAAYRFETQFRVKVEQAGQVKLDRVYGARNNLKVWAFGSKLKSEVAWPWGAVENIVWEGHDVFVDLEPGRASITLTAGPQPAPQAKRNVDLIMLTRDEAQVKMRIEKEQYLPLDGMLTQAGDVWMKIDNRGTGKLAVKSLLFPGGPLQQHSPYWTHIRNWKPVSVELESGQTTEWIEVGGTMDTLNDGQWGFQSSGPCKIEFGVKDAAGRITPVRTFDVNGNLPLVAQADARYNHRFRTQSEATQELFDYVKSLKLPDTRLRLTYVSASGSLPREFYDFYSLNGVHMSGSRIHADWRALSAAQIEEKCLKMAPAEREKIFIMSLGDEIGLPQPDGKTASAGFVTFLKSQGLTPVDVDPAAAGDWSKILYSTDDSAKTDRPSLYYWSHRYLYSYGIQEIKKQTEVLRKYLPTAHIGANYSPHHGGGEYTFLGETFKWVTCFRDDGMTLPWSEDYIWQVPVATPQVNGISLDLFRAGQRGKAGRKTLYYVMPHMPGNTPPMWRRLWHNAIGHGATILSLFEFNPVWVAYTENHVTGKEMYAEVLKAIRELGLYEDIVQSGQVRRARTALWFSETGDIWRDNTPSFGAAKRGLYVAIQNQQLPLDFVVEPDALDGTLKQYEVLYLTDNHVSRAASAKIAEWVSSGGRLFASAGAGMFDELNRPNTVLRGLLGVNQTELVMPPDQQVHFIKQDLNFVEPVGEITLQDAATRFAAFGVISRVMAAEGTKVLGTFADGSPAVITNTAGKGNTIYSAFLPSLSFFKPAVPLKPLDRGTSDDAMSHFLPTKFDPVAGRLIGLVAADVVRPLVCDAQHVETSVIESHTGTAIVVTNWSGNPIRGLKLTVNISLPANSIALAGGGQIEMRTDGDKTLLTFDLDVADTIILR